MCVLGRPMFNQRFIPHKESFNKILKKKYSNRPRRKNVNSSSYSKFNLYAK